MIVYHCKQGTPEWVGLRLGIPTASSFDRIITPKGKPSTQAEKYRFELLGERMSGHPETDFKSSWMERGSDWEGDAVNFYELQRDCETESVGFISNDTGTWGASPDSLVGPSGQLEIKCPKASTHVGYLLQAGSAYEEYRIQVQGQLWIAERDWCDVISYNSEMPMALTRIERDDAFISILSKAVAAFSEELEALSLDIIARGWLRPDWKPEYVERKAPSEKTGFSHQDIISEMREAMRGL